MSTTLILGVMAACVLGLILLAILGRLNDAPDDEPAHPDNTGPEEPLGDMIDVPGLLQKWSEK